MSADPRLLGGVLVVVADIGSNIQPELRACGSLFFHPKGSDPGKRWSLVQANTACSAEIERKRWGSLQAIFTYKQREPDHGYTACMASKLPDESRPSTSPED